MKTKLVILILILCSIVSETFAQGISATNFLIEAKKGRKTEYIFGLVGSDINGKQEVIVYASGLHTTRNGGYFFDINGGVNPCKDWIKFPKKKWSLTYQKETECKIKIKVPYSAEPGEYYVAIMIETGKGSKAMNANKSIQLEQENKLALTLCVIVPGRTYLKKGIFVGKEVIKNTKKIILIATAFKNDGRTIIKAKGEVHIKDKDGLSFGSFPIMSRVNKKGVSSMLPGSIVDMVGYLNRPLPSGDYTATIEVDYGYKYKKAKKKVAFSVKRKVPLDEKNNNYIYLESKEYSLEVPEGSRRSQLVKFSNQDNRPLKISFELPEGVTVSPKILSLAPGKSWNSRMSVSVKKYNDAGEKIFIIKVIPERGKSSKIKLTALKNKINKK